MSKVVLTAVVEVPRGGFVKREWGPKGFVVDYISPVPAPFNYGCIPERMGPDGDPVDVVILGARLALGTRVHGVCTGRVLFEDNGVADHKWVMGPWQLRDEGRLRRFFAGYAWARSGMNWVKGRRGARFLGVERG